MLHFGISALQGVLPEVSCLWYTERLWDTSIPGTDMRGKVQPPSLFFDAKISSFLQEVGHFGLALNLRGGQNFPPSISLVKSSIFGLKRHFLH